MGPANKNAPVPTTDTGPEIGDRITDAMEQKNIDNRTLARMCDVGERAVSQWKRDGKVSRDKLPLLCQALGVTSDFILGISSAEDQTIVDDDNLITFQPRVNKIDNQGPEVQLRRQNIVYAPVMEYPELLHAIHQAPGHVTDLLKSFTQNQESRAVIPYMVNADEELDGVPQFFIQLLESTYAPHFNKGDFLGVTSTWTPWRGELCLFAVKNKRAARSPNRETETEYGAAYRLVMGYYYPISERVSMVDPRQQFRNIWDFVLRCKRDEESPDDVEIQYETDEAWYIGMVTFCFKWTMEVHKLRHTSYTSRQEAVTRGMVWNYEAEGNEWGKKR